MPHIVKYNLDRSRKCSGNVENNKRTKVDFMVCSAMFCKKNKKKISDPIYIEKGWLPPSEELFESLELRAALKTIRVE